MSIDDNTDVESSPMSVKRRRSVRFMSKECANDVNDEHNATVVKSTKESKIPLVRINDEFLPVLKPTIFDVIFIDSIRSTKDVSQEPEKQFAMIRMNFKRKFKA